MRFLAAIVDALVGFIQRNPLTFLLIVLVGITAPALLKGLAMLVLYAILGLLLAGVLLLVIFGWRVRSMQRRMEEQFSQRFGNGGPFGNKGGDPFGTAGRGGSRSSWGDASSRDREGEVHLYRTSDTPEKRISKEVGDYVEFEETASDDER